MSNTKKNYSRTISGLTDSLRSCGTTDSLFGGGENTVVVEDPLLAYLTAQNNRLPSEINLSVRSSASQYQPMEAALEQVEEHHHEDRLPETSTATGISSQEEEEDDDEAEEDLDCPQLLFCSDPNMRALFKKSCTSSSSKPDAASSSIASSGNLKDASWKMPTTMAKRSQSGGETAVTTATSFSYSKSPTQVSDMDLIQDRRLVTAEPKRQHLRTPTGNLLPVLTSLVLDDEVREA